MKKLLILLIAIAVIGGGAAWYLMRPTGVQVQALLTPDGPDVTDLVQWDVDGVLSRDSNQGITLDMVEERSSSLFDPTFYAVTPGQLTEVEGVVRGNVRIRAEVAAARGEVVEQTFILDAGIIDLELLQSEGRSLRLDIASGSSVQSFFPDEDGSRLFLTAGDYTLSLTDPDADLRLASTMITVAAGSTQAVTLDGRVGTVQLSLDPGFDWPEDLPPLAYVIETETGFGAQVPKVFGADGLGREAVLPFGEHSVQIVADPVGPMDMPRPDPITFTVDQDSAIIPIAFPMQLVRFTIEGLPDGATDTRLRIVESDYKGEYVAARDFDGTTPAIAFDDLYYEGTDTNFAAFLRVDGTVVATVPLGLYEPGAETSATLVYGEGMPLCEELFGDGYCLKTE